MRVVDPVAPEVREAMLLRARRAMEAGHRLAGGYTAFARALTDNQSMRVVMDSKGPPRTDGKMIVLVPPLALGDNLRHEVMKCNRFDSNGLPLCSVCALHEDINSDAYHEIAHNVHESFNTDRDEKGAMRLANAESQWLGLTVNAIEDARVNQAMHTARPGTRRMFKARSLVILSEGIPLMDGSFVRLADRDASTQMLLGFYYRSSGYDFDLTEHVSADVFADLANPEVDKLAKRARFLDTVWDSLDVARKALELFQSMGYMQDEESEPEEPEEGDDGDGGEDEDSDDDGSDGDEGEQRGDHCDDGDPGEDSKGEPGEGAAGDTKDEDGVDSDADSGGDSEGGDQSDDTDTADGSGDDAGDPSADGTEGPGDGSTDGSEDDGDSGDSGTRLDTNPDGEASDKVENEGAPSDRIGGTEGTGNLEGSGSDLDGMDDNPRPKENLERIKRDVSHMMGHGDENLDVDEQGERIESDSDLAAPADVSPTEWDAPASPTEKQVLQTAEKQRITGFNKPGVGCTGLDVIKFNERGPRHVFESEYGDMRTGMKPSHSPYRAPMVDRIVTKSVAAARQIFTENLAVKNTRNLKAGRLDRKNLGVKLKTGREDVFSRKINPSKRDYSVIVGLDVSGSTGGRLSTMLQAVYGQCELLHRLGIEFKLMCHSGGYGSGTSRSFVTQLLLVKDWQETWGSEEIMRRFNAIRPAAANLDGHTLEYYLNEVSRRETTDKLIMYYTDGSMPCENYDEELEVLKSTCGRIQRLPDTHLLAAAFACDDPVKYGLDTVRFDTPEDLPQVVEALRKKVGAS